MTTDHAQTIKDAIAHGATGYQYHWEDALAALDALVELVNAHIERAEAAEAALAEARRIASKTWDEEVAADKARAIKAEIRAEKSEADRDTLTAALEHLCVWVEIGCDHYGSDREAIEAARAALARLTPQGNPE